MEIHNQGLQVLDFEMLKKRRKSEIMDVSNNTQAFYIYRIAHITSWSKVLLHEP